MFREYWEYSKCSEYSTNRDFIDYRDSRAFWENRDYRDFKDYIKSSTFWENMDYRYFEDYEGV